MRKLFLALVLLAIAAMTTSVIWRTVGSAGTSGLENWIGRQIVGVLQNYITPQIAFESLDYQAPATVIIQPLTLTADGQPMITVQRIELTLAERPRRGEPIQIERIHLTRPQVNFVRNDAGDFIGWSNFVRSSPQTTPTTPATHTRFSDILVLRRVEIDNGTLLYDDADPTTAPMTLPGISVALNTAPEPDQPGWYALDGSMGRPELFELDLTSRVNVNTSVLDISALTFSAGLTEDAYGSFPPALQNSLRTHNIQGHLRLTLAGHLPLNTPLQASGHCDASIDNLRVTSGNRIWSAKTCQLNIQTANDGALPATGNLNVDGARLMHLPIVAQFLDVLDKATPGLEANPTDQARVEFTLHEDHAELTKAEVLSTVIALRGTGQVNYAGTLDLRVNAGVLERVESKLGALGDLIGAVRDKLIAYKVTGNVSAPKVTVSTLGR